MIELGDENFIIEIQLIQCMTINYVLFLASIKKLGPGKKLKGEILGHENFQLVAISM